MSSATMPESNAASKVISAVTEKTMRRIERLGLSPRQQMLNRLYAYYRCAQYEACRIDWDGNENVGRLDHEAIATAGFIPAGFYDAGSTFPLKFRKPHAPYNLAKAIVDRFTGLLFSERRHPAFRVAADADTEDFVTALAQRARLWPQMIKARSFGGAMGTVAVGGQYVDGRPIIEVHDPRWLFPEFADRSEQVLASIEKRYIFPKEERDLRTGNWVTNWFWYRRVIDGLSDTLYAEEPVEEGDEPNWKVAKVVVHEMGQVPVFWVQNLPVQDDVDGDPDCQGTFDTIDAFDMVQAQAVKGVVKNCDPTAVIVTDAALGSLRKGSDNAVKLPAGSSASYMELEGTSIQIARDMGATLRTQILEISSCILEHPNVAQRTATEVVRLYDAMYEKADVLREQYGERCMKPLVTLLLERARRSKGSGTVKLPPRIVEGKAVARTVPLGNGSPIDLNWPPYERPTPQDAAQAVNAAVAAVNGKLVDREHAINAVAPLFDVEDVPAMIAKIAEESATARAEMQEDMMGGIKAAGDEGVKPDDSGAGGGAKGNEDDTEEDT